MLETPAHARNDQRPTLTNFLERDLMAVGRTCKATEPLYRDLQKTQWKIDVKLSRFFRGPKEFRSVLGESDVIVSGSFVLQFFGTF